MSMTVSVDGSPDAIYATMRHEGGFERSDAKMLAGMRASISMGSGTALSKSSSAATAAVALRLSFDGGGTQAVEYRVVHGKVYLRVDLDALSATPAMSAGDRKQIAAVRKSASSMPASLAPVKAAIAGKWVSIDTKALGQFEKNMGAPAGAMGMPGTGSSQNAATQKKLSAALRKVLLHDAKFTDEGTRGGLDHVKATLPAGKAARELAKELKPLAGKLPGMPLSELSKAPKKTLAVDFGLSGGHLRTMTVDLSQLDKKMTGHLPLVVAFGSGATDLTAPAGAVAMNPGQLLGGLGALGPDMGGPDTSTGSGGNAS